MLLYNPDVLMCWIWCFSRNSSFIEYKFSFFPSNSAKISTPFFSELKTLKLANLRLRSVSNCGGPTGPLLRRLCGYTEWTNLLKHVGLCTFQNRTMHFLPWNTRRCNTPNCDLIPCHAMPCNTVSYNPNDIIPYNVIGCPFIR